jgi:hypothetical protein
VQLPQNNFSVEKEKFTPDLLFEKLESVLTRQVTTICYDGDDGVTFKLRRTDKLDLLLSHSINNKNIIKMFVC